jgi:CheY-like chemotaxis protein
VEGPLHPARDGPPGEEPPGKDRPAGDDRPARIETILFVDDDVDLVELLTLGLGELGYRVSAFSDPARAIAEFRSTPGSFDAVVSDLAMPRISGLQLARQVLEIRPGTPVVLMSGYVREEDEAAAKEIGILGFAAKGYSTVEIARELDRILRGGPSPDVPPDDGDV